LRFAALSTLIELVLHPGDPIKPAKAKAKVLKLKNG